MNKSSVVEAAWPLFGSFLPLAAASEPAVAMPIDKRQTNSMVTHPVTGDTHIDALPLNTRARNCLREEGIKTVQELREWADPSNVRQLRTVINMGPKTLAHVRKVIRNL